MARIIFFIEFDFVRLYCPKEDANKVKINKSRIEERYFKVILFKKSYLRIEIIAIS
jgi:hypothetical protein